MRLPGNGTVPCRGDRGLLGLDTTLLAYHMATWNYFQSVESEENAAFVAMWRTFTANGNETTNDPMEATFIRFRILALAVTQAGSTDVNAVRQAMYSQSSLPSAASVP